MTSRTKRLIARTWKEVSIVFVGLSILTAVFTLIVSPFLSAAGKQFIPWVLPIVWIVVLTALFVVRRKLFRPERKYFETIEFGESNEDTFLRSLNGILNTEKAAPYWVHVAPKPDEVGNIISKLSDSSFVRVMGASGSGKTMAAYQAAFALKCEQKHQIYRLNVEDLQNKTSVEFTQLKNEILNELDGLKGNSNKLVLIDDAHMLVPEDELFSILQIETTEGNGKLIWIESELPSSDIAEFHDDECVRINLADFLPRLLDEFYHSSDQLLQSALEQHAKGLDDAINRFQSGKIRDIWHFNFCATQGWEKLTKKVHTLSNFRLLVLFSVSAHTVISGEEELNSKDVVNNIRSLESATEFSSQFQWLREHTSVQNALEDLANQKLILMYDKSPQDKGYIAPLHYNFAREVVRTSLLRQHLTNDLMTSVKILLSNEYHRCTWIANLLTDLGQYAPQFIDSNKSWISSYLNNVSPKRFISCATLLEMSSKITIAGYNELLEHLDVETISKSVDLVQPIEFHRLSRFIDSLGKRREELVKELVKEPHLSKLATTANSTQPCNFDGLERLLTALGDERKELVKELVKEPHLSKLATTASAAQPGNFHGMAGLLTALGDKRKQLLKELDFSQLATTASAAQPGNFHGMAGLLTALGDERKELLKELVKEPHLSKLATTANSAQPGNFDGLAGLLTALGDKRKELLKELDFSQLAKTASAAQPGNFHGLADLLTALGDKREELLKELVKEPHLSKLATKANSAQPGNFPGLADLLSALGDKGEKLVEELDFSQLAKTASAAQPGNFHGLADLLTALGDKGEKLVKELDFSQLAKSANSAQPGDFDSLAGSLTALGDKRENLVKELVKEPYLSQLVKTASAAQPHYFDKVAGLLTALGDKREEVVKELLKEPYLSQLAKTASAAQPHEFDKVAGLLTALGDKREKLVKELDLLTLKNRVKEFKAHDTTALADCMSKVTHLMSGLDDDSRNEFIRDIPWDTFCMKCPIEVSALAVLGQCLENVIRQGEQPSIGRIKIYLENNAEAFKTEIRKANPSHYGGISKFLWNCNLINHGLSLKIVSDTKDKLAERLRVMPWNYRGAGQLINSIYSVDPSLAGSLVNDRLVRGRILAAINGHKWIESLADFRHLIKAFYRANPTLWRTAIRKGWITADLSPLDLPSIYREIDAERDYGHTLITE